MFNAWHGKCSRFHAQTANDRSAEHAERTGVKQRTKIGECVTVGSAAITALASVHGLASFLQIRKQSEKRNREERKRKKPHRLTSNTSNVYLWLTYDAPSAWPSTCAILAAVRPASGLMTTTPYLFEPQAALTHEPVVLPPPNAVVVSMIT